MKTIGEMDKQIIVQMSRERLTDSVVKQMTQLLHEQAWKPGERLPSEAELANRFGVSKTVIREALRGLAAMQVIEIKQGKLPTVCVPTSEPLERFFRFATNDGGGGIREAIELRTALETYTAALAAERITDQELIELEECVAQLRRFADEMDPWTDADLKFHTLIAKSAKNRLVFHLTVALGEMVRETIRTLFVPELRDGQATFGRHLRVFEALQAHDPERARKAMTEHFDATKSFIKVIIDQAEVKKQEG
jgi:GntR family transcriptional regulator, transcriptional repressor for pyruvate dehydrogenase complex